MGLLDLMGSLGGMGGMGDIEKMGADFVAHMAGTKSSLAAVLENQRVIMEKLGVGEQFVAPVKTGVIENAG